MPAILASNIDFETGKYYIDLGELHQKYAYINENKKLRIFLLEVRDKNNKLVKRFKPFKEIELPIYKYYSAWREKIGLALEQNIARDFNIGHYYKIVFIISACDGKPFLPFELKTISYNAKRAKELLSRIEIELLLTVLEQPKLNEALSYLWDAYRRLEENDIEGARTSIRKALSDTIESEFIPRIKVLEETQEFPQKIRGFLNALIDFVHYGGPHKGPAIRTTTQMVLLISLEIVRFLATALEEKIISLKQGGSDALHGEGNG